MIIMCPTVFPRVCILRERMQQCRKWKRGRGSGTVWGLFTKIGHMSNPIGCIINWLCLCLASNCELELAPGPGVRKSPKRERDEGEEAKTGALNRTKQSETNGNVTVYKKKEVWSKKENQVPRKNPSIISKACGCRTKETEQKKISCYKES